MKFGIYAKNAAEFLGQNWKKVLRKYVLWMIYFSIRILVPMLYLKRYIASVRRRRPSLSSSVRPSRPSVAVVRRRRRPLSVRPSRPSVVVRRRRLPANPRPHANFWKTHQNRSPTASGLWNSESTRKMLQISWVKIEKVCFMDDLLFHKNFGPKVDNNKIK